MTDLRVAAGAFARTRWLGRVLRTPERVRLYQQRRLRVLERHLETNIPFYRDDSRRTFTNWPVVDKTTMLADFARFNIAGLTLDAVRTALAEDRQSVEGYAVGRSTGTSGNRGYYVISERERFVWLGTVLAKTLPDALWRRHRVALVLPGFSSLYQSAESGSRIQLGFFDLAQGVDRLLPWIGSFAPDTVVAPPKVLRILAETGQLRAKHLFSGAEVLDPLDRTIVERATGRILREIYMATEGLLAVSCPYGGLHLAEDVVHFEWEREPASDRLRVPIVTDFTRRAQALARYRMNDLLELDPTPCPCGSAFARVKRLEGRCDDVFLLAAPNGTLRRVTPDVLRNAVLDADPAIDDFRIRQTGPSAVDVQVPGHVDDLGLAAVRHGLERLAVALRLAPLEIAVERGITVPIDRKLRRVRRDWRAPGERR